MQGRHILALLRRGLRRRLPGLPPGDRPVMPSGTAARRRVQLLADELDQADLPVDDVPLRLGHERESRSHARASLRSPAFFDEVLAAAVPSSWDRRHFSSPDEWSQAVARSSVRLQWDPDHHPHGNPLARRAVQLGLRGPMLAAFAGSAELLEVIDLSQFVALQRQQLAGAGCPHSTVPRQRVYRPAHAAVADRLGLGLAHLHRSSLTPFFNP